MFYYIALFCAFNKSAPKLFYCAFNKNVPKLFYCAFNKNAPKLFYCAFNKNTQKLFYCAFYLKSAVYATNGDKKTILSHYLSKKHNISYQR